MPSSKTRRPISQVDHDVIPAKLRRKREVTSPPASATKKKKKNKNKNENKKKHINVNINKIKDKNANKNKIQNKNKNKNKSKSSTPKFPPIPSSILDGGPSLVDVVIDQHHVDLPFSSIHSNIEPTTVDQVPISPIREKIGSNQKDSNFVLWMALSKEEKLEEGEGKLFTLKELRIRQKQRAKNALEQLAMKRNLRKEKNLAKLHKRQEQQRKARAKRQKKKAEKMKQQKQKKQKRQKREGGISIVGKFNTTTDTAIETEIRTTEDTKEIENVSAAMTQIEGSIPTTPIDSTSRGAATATAATTTIAEQQKETANESSVAVVTPSSKSRSRPRFERLSISREERSETTYQEFKKILFAQDDHKARVYKEQFRGGNPFMLQSKSKTKSLFPRVREEERSEDIESNKVVQERKRRQLSGKFDENVHGHISYYCQSRRCGRVVVFPNDENKLMTTCEYCGHLNNRREFIRVGTRRVSKPSSSIVKSHSDISREKFKLKLRDRFLDNINEVIHHLSNSAKERVSPGKRIWKEFDRTQQRLAHTWKQPTPAAHDYGVPWEGTRMQRVRAGTRSVPAFNFAPKRHQKKTSIEMSM
jgi:hypothetical protein